MRILLGVTAALTFSMAPALAQTTPAALPTQCAFTAAPTIPDGASATNAAMRDAREALEAWRSTRAVELAECNAAAQALQAQAQAAAAAHNAAASETDSTIRRFAAENEEYTNRGAASGRRAVTRPDQ